MFNILQEWLTNKLGITNCWNLNFNNVGERFKDGVLFAHLLQKYQIIPDCYVQDFKKTNNYTACLRNIKSINIWLKFLDIFIEDCVIYEIANGLSLAVTKLLYELYCKLETSKQTHIYDNANNWKIESINNLTNFCNSNYLSIKFNQDRKKQGKISNTKEEIFNSYTLFSCSEGIKYTAVDVIKSKKYSNANKNYTLNFIHDNMNYFYDLFKKNLNSDIFKNDLNEKYIEICKNSIFYYLYVKEDTTADHLSYTSQKEIKHENLTLNSSENKSLTTQSSDNYSNKLLVKQDIFYDYIHHTGLWSSDLLNIKPYECRQDILPMIVREVLNFDYDKSKIQFLEIKKTNLAGVIDVIQNTKVTQLIKSILSNKEIMSFTADDALTSCLKKYKEEIMISMSKEKLYQVLEENEQKITPKQYIDNKKREKHKDTIKNDVKNNSINSEPESKPKVIKSVLNTNTESMQITNEKFNTNKLTQTPEQIPEPDYNNPILSSMGALGKLIDEKQMKNLDLQISDVINCIGEYIENNQGKNGWLLIDFPVQPLQMSLLEYKLTRKIPAFGKEICKHNKKKSKIISEYQDGENIFASKNTYLSHCIKIIKHQDEIKNEKWNDFLQFYKQDCIQVIINQFSNTMMQPKKVANALIGLILNEENNLETKKILKSVKMFDDDEDNQVDDDSSESENNDQQQISELSLLNHKDTNSINSKQITNQFQILSTGSNLNNYTHTALFLSNMWETMEHNYIHQIKETLNFRDNFFEEIKTKMNLITTIVDDKIYFHNPSITNLINKYENESFLKYSPTNKMHSIFELQSNLWDEVDSELEQITQSIEQIIESQHAIDKNSTLISIHKQLIDIELKRTATTLNFVNKYYDDINDYKINEFDHTTNINEFKNDTDNFQLLCTDITHTIEKYVENICKVIEKIDNKAWTTCLHTEKNRFVSQASRIKASMFKDHKYLTDLTKIDHHLQNIQNIYQFKINDINKLCEILKCAISTGIGIKGNIKQISGKFYINETSIYEIINNQIFDSRNKFNTKHLKTLVDILLDYAPTFKMSINDLIGTLNELCKEQHIYPTNWPTNVEFHNSFLKEILGSNVITIDWRDFVVQCMELPYPSIDQLLTYRKLFQANDIGDETIAIENYITTKLWFETEPDQKNEAKWLLCDMYQVNNRLNYSTMLLAFCRDEQPWIGLRKSFCLLFGWNPLDVKMQHVNQSEDEYYEGSDIDVEDIDSSFSESSNEKFTFDKNTMKWFLTTVLKLYIDNEKLGINYISQTVESVFTYFQTKREKPTIINLFHNNVMNELYNTVKKFQVKELSEIAKKIVMANEVPI